MKGFKKKHENTLLATADIVVCTLVFLMMLKWSRKYVRKQESTENNILLPSNVSTLTSFQTLLHTHRKQVI